MLSPSTISDRIYVLLFSHVKEQVSQITSLNKYLNIQIKLFQLHGLLILYFRYYTLGIAKT